MNRTKRVAGLIIAVDGSFLLLLLFFQGGLDRSVSSQPACVAPTADPVSARRIAGSTITIKIHSAFTVAERQYGTFKPLTTGTPIRP